MWDLLDSRRLQLVLTALLRIASSQQPLSGKLLADILGCSRRYLESDLQALVQEGILESRRGAHGGYRLAKNPHRVSLLDILRCLATEDKAERTKACELQRKVVCQGLTQTCKDIENTLASVSLASWLKQGQELGLLKSAKTTPDFCI